MKRQKFVIPFSDILALVPTWLRLGWIWSRPVAPSTLWPFASQYAVPNLTNQLGNRNFPGEVAHQNKFFRECQPIKWERTPARVVDTEIARVTGENWFLTPWKLIFTTVEIDFYHHWKLIFYHRGNWILPPWKIDWKLIFLPPWKIDFYHRGKLIFFHRGNWILP